MAVNIKFTKFDNTPWGFRLAGGSDFPQPLTVIRVTEGGLAECMGLKVGDVVVRLNDQPISSLTHGQAHEELTRAGNNFVLGVLREGESLRSVEAFSDENIVPYKIPLADLPPVFPEEILKEETVIERYEEIKTVEVEVKPEVEPLPDKPKDANSEIVPNQNLTDDEIAQLILEEEELLTDKGLLGVNFNKLRPRVTALKQSKVIEELQSIATAEPPLVEQLKRTSVFLQKPQRPIPVPRKKQEEEATEEEAAESYKVVIKKQKKRSVTDRLLERGLLKPEGASTPEPPTPEVNMEMESKIEEDDSSIVPSIQLDDSSRLQEPLEPTATLSAASASSVEPPLEIRQSRSPVQVQVELELDLELELEPEVETPCDDSQSDVAPLQLMSTRKESNLALPRKAASKRKSKGFYTRAHYFRRCLFGKKSCPEVKRATKTRPSSLRERGAPQLEDPARGRRSSIEMCSKSRIKGRYLETYLKREDNWMRRMIDGLLEKPSSFCSSKSFDRLLASREISFRRTRYAEKILLRSIEFVAVRLRSDILKRLEKPCSSPLASNSRIRKRLYSKGRYFERIFWRVVSRLMNCMKGSGTAQPYDSKVRGRDRRRSSAMIKTKGRYLQTYLSRTAFFDLGDSFATHPTVVSSKRKLFARTRYVERILKKHLQCLGLIVSYVRCRILQGISDSSIVIPAGSSLNSRQSDASLKGDDDVLSNLIRSSTGFISNEVFHRGSRRLSRSSRGSVSLPSDTWSWTNYLCSWLPLKFPRESSETVISEKKIIQDSDRDSRRLSFVPTILYEGLTNRIGVDFTRLVAYAFVPCTSIILLYMYK